MSKALAYKIYNKALKPTALTRSRLVQSLGLTATHMLENNLKLKEVLEELGREQSISLGKQTASDLNIQWEGSIAIVFNAIVNDFERAPGNIGGKNDNHSDAIRKWIVVVK